MIAKHAHKFGPEWDVYLQQLVFAYRVKPHESTGEAPFYLVYGRDARLPTETALSRPLTPYQVDISDYQTELVVGLSEAWKIAQTNIARAQCRQKAQHDKRLRDLRLKVGDRVMIYMPHEASGKQRKLALPYHGPYRVLDVTPSGVSVRPVDRPKDEPILVNLERVTKCPEVLLDVWWLGPRRKRKQRASC